MAVTSRGTGRIPAAWVHGMALFTAGATVLLIFVGGVVTNTGSALAVPDWPTTYGRFMFLYPLSGMVGGILYEHSHRLLGALVGLLTVLLAAALWGAPAGGRLRALGLVAVGAVMAQGVLGGLRVVLLQNTLAVVHGIVAQTFFGLIVGLAVCTSPGWSAAARTAATAGDAPPLRRLCWAAVGIIYVQIVLGALLAHTGDALHAHLLAAILVSGMVLWLSARVLGSHAERPGLARPARLLAALVIAQLGLGVGTYLSRFTALGAGLSPALALAFPVLHRVGGTLLLGTSLVLALRAQRVLQPPVAAEDGALSEGVPA